MNQEKMCPLRTNKIIKKKADGITIIDTIPVPCMREHCEWWTDAKIRGTHNCAIYWIGYYR